jgi:hypothetical protein
MTVELMATRKLPQDVVGDVVLQANWAAGFAFLRVRG